MAQEPVTNDELVSVKITTPGGLILTLDPDYIPSDNVRSSIRDGRFEGAAIALCNMTGCAVTIERTRLTTSKP